MVQKLLMHFNLDVNIQDAEGHTALIWAADKSHMDIVKTLLAVQNIYPNIQSNEGFSALICPSGQGCFRL